MRTNKTTRPEWEPKNGDKRTLTDLIDDWHTLHGTSLKTGEDRRRALERIAEGLGNPPAATITAATFSNFRAKRLKTVSGNTANHELAYMRALFNDLSRLGKWTGPNPVAGIRRIKTSEKELAFLTVDQIDHLLTTLDEGDYYDAPSITRICLATGARWPEAEELRRENMYPGRIDLTDTKNGRNRSIPIPACIYRRHKGHRGGRLFRYSYDAFRRAMKDAEIETPPGQLARILRHTFASHFMMNGGNILSLQRILGHGNLTMTMRYAHLAPEHLEEAARLNPLA